MARTLEEVFSGVGGPPSEVAGFDELQVAICMLLMRVAYVDREYHPEERRRIQRLLHDKLGISVERVKDLMRIVDREVAENDVGVFSCWFVITEELAEEDFSKLVGMLWDVAYADGVVHEFERRFVTRVANHLDLTQSEIDRIERESLSRVKGS